MRISRTLRFLSAFVGVLLLVWFGLPEQKIQGIVAPVSACTWVTTSCGSGCADNKDLYNCSSSVSIKSVSASSSNPDSNAKAKLVAPPTVTQYVPATNQQPTQNAINYITKTPGQTVAKDVLTTDDTGLGGSISMSIGQAAIGTGLSTNCGAAGQTYCDPFAAGGKICNPGLYANTATGKCQATPPANLCSGDGGGGGTIGSTAQCAMYICEGGCNNGGQCNKLARLGNCNTMSLNGQCGQIDFLNGSGQYCGVQAQNCGGGCAQKTTTPTTSPPPTTTTTTQPTPTPSATCGQPCGGVTKTYCSGANMACVSGTCRSTLCAADEQNAQCICTSPPPVTAICVDIYASKVDPKLNDQVSFTCAPVANAVRYEFRYSYFSSKTSIDGATLNTLGSLTATSNKSLPLTISKVGRYVAQCRPCAANNLCSEWEPMSGENKAPKLEPAS